MSVQTQDGILLAVALFTMASCVYFYIAAVVDEDRALSRSAALAFVVFCVAAVVMAVRILR
jgi:hypothetical protein